MTATQKLEEETRIMEEQLKQIQSIAELEKQKKSMTQMRASGGNSMWRSATTNQPIAGYDKKVMQHVIETRGRPPVPKKQPAQLSRGTD